MDARGEHGAPADASSARALACRVGSCVVAVPLANVLEVMRPLPMSEIAGAPPFVLGVSVIRGEPLPVVDASMLVEGRFGASTRFVRLAAGGRRLALAVGAVLGVLDASDASSGEAPALLGAAAEEAIAAVGVKDGELVVLLRALRIVPEATWRALAERGAT